MRGTTVIFGCVKRDLCISIHVPRAGYDNNEALVTSRRNHFYPRTPCGVRQSRRKERETMEEFLSTYPVRGTTSGLATAGSVAAFLSTYPVRGTTACRMGRPRATRYFYPRTPCGVRRGACASGLRGGDISIHVPRAGYDISTLFVGRMGINFYPRTPCGVRQETGLVGSGVVGISIHVPRAGYDR